MKAKLISLLLFFFISVALFAQENETKSKIKYSNITEFGFLTTSPQGFSFEATTAHGFSIKKIHHFGLGMGIGVNLLFTKDNVGTAYMPLFLNYRFYFNPNKSFSPHLNVSLGAAIPQDGGGVYSSATMGFKAGKFSFSSGVSFMAIYRNESWYDPIYDPYVISNYSQSYRWRFPVGITLKWGFTF